MAVQPLAIIAPINLSLRSPYSFQTTPGLPPAYVAQGVPVHLNEQGQPVVAGMVLQGFATTSQQAGVQVSPTYDTGKYADFESSVFRFTGVGFPVDANGNALVNGQVLARPNNNRVSLLIQNNTIGLLYYAFGRAADNVSCVAVAAGGAREFDVTVPQGYLSLYAMAAGSAVVEYANNNVS